MRITTSNALLALSAAAISAAPADAFVSPVPQMVAPGRGAKDLAASRPRLSRPLASRLDMQVSPDQRAKDAKVRGGAAAPLGAVAMPASDRVSVAPRGVTSNAAVLADSLLKAALHSSVIVALIGAAQFLSARFSPVGTPQATMEAGRWALWAGTVFASGAIAAGPKKWVENSDLIKVLNVDVAASKEWYDNLRKPWFNPPKWAFPVMWIPLKVLQVCACYEMWSQLKVRSFLAAPVVVYAVYKSLGDAWNKIFFESRRLKMANVIMSLYLTSLLISVKLFFDVSTKAGLLFAPTVAWISVATCLQWNTWALNRDDPHA